MFSSVLSWSPQPSTMKIMCLMPVAGGAGQPVAAPLG
jgi:hypothetical protein